MLLVVVEGEETVMEAEPLAGGDDWGTTELVELLRNLCQFL